MPISLPPTLFPASSPFLLLLGILLAHGISSFPADTSGLTADTRQTWCTASNDWTQPRWPATVHMACERILHHLEVTQPEIHGTLQAHEFLPMDVVPRYPWVGSTVRTPWKLTLGEFHLRCSSEIPRTYLEVDVFLARWVHFSCDDSTVDRVWRITLVHIPTGGILTCIRCHDVV